MDMLVDLYQLPPAGPEEEQLASLGIQIKQALAPDKGEVLAFLQSYFPEYQDEAAAAFARMPVTCYLAVKEKEIVGFACYEATARNFFGPMGVRPDARRQGIGAALLLRSLWSQREMGYAYAIIGWPSKMAVSLYEKTVGAIHIGHGKGIYRRMVAED